MVSSTTARVNFSRSISSVAVDRRVATSAARLLLGRGIEREQIQRPEQRGGGGLVAGENHGRDLVAELFVGEGLRRSRDRAPHPSDRTGRAAARPRSCRRRGAPPSACRRNASIACGSARGKNPAGSASPAAAAVEQMRPRQPLAIFHHEIAQGRAVTAHPEREHGAPGDLERHPLHRFAQIDRLRRCCFAAWRWFRPSPRSCAEPAVETARGVKAGASVRR